MSKQHAQMSEGVSFKSLDSESIGAARAAARASGMSLEDWLSRTILESVRARGESAAAAGDAHGPAADDPGWAAARDDSDETIDAITRHLMEAKAAADQAGVSVAEWLSRTILDNAQEEQAAANSNLPGASVYPFAAASGQAAPDLPNKTEVDGVQVDGSQVGGAQADGAEDDGSREDRLARIIAARRAEVEAEEEAKQPDLLADLEMPERPMTLTKNMQMPHSLPRFEAERRRRFPWLWLSVMLLMVAAAAMIWLVPLLPGPDGGKPNETTVAVGGGTGGDAKSPTRTTGKSSGTSDGSPPKAGDAKTSAKAPKGDTTGAKSGTSSAARKTDPATKAPATALPRSSETRLDKLPKPIEKYLGWYQRAAEGGNPTAQFALGSHMIRQKNMKAAATYMRMAANQGHAEAQYTLGAMYAYGLGVPKSDVDAVLMYNKAADQGYVPAITEVGLAYLHGRGVERNLKKAFTSLERAAEANEPNAQYTLGRLYESGIGVKKDLVMAFKWFILAAENKHQLAASRVEDLSIDLSRDQRERGSELVREHKQRFPKKSG